MGRTRELTEPRPSIIPWVHKSCTIKSLSRRSSPTQTRLGISTIPRLSTGSTAPASICTAKWTDLDLPSARTSRPDDNRLLPGASDRMAGVEVRTWVTKLAAVDGSLPGPLAGRKMPRENQDGRVRIQRRHANERAIVDSFARSPKNISGTNTLNERKILLQSTR